MPDEKEYEVRFKWQNGNYFTMSEKLQDGVWVDIITARENTYFAAIAECLKSMCLSDITVHLDRAMTEMCEPPDGPGV